MRALYCRDWCDFDDLTIEDLPDPAVEPGMLRLKVLAGGLGFAQSLVVAGKYQRKPPRPFTPGTEVAGEVLECGPGVTRFAPGDKVLAHLDWGGFAEQTLAFETAAFRVPDGLDPVAVEPLIVSYLTSYCALVWRAKLQPGEVLLVHGASGGVGLGAVEIGKALGATVIAAAGSPEKRALLAERGADHVIDSRAEGMRHTVKELTDGRGADVIYDPVGGAAFDESMRCIREHGRILVIGFASGVIPAAPANLLLVKNVTLLGFNAGVYIGWNDPADRDRYHPNVAEAFDRMFAWTQEGKLRPTVSHRFDLADFRAAMRTVLERDAIGKVLLVP